MNSKTSKKLLSFALAAAMVFALLPMTVFSAGIGTGTQGNPFIITTAERLYEFAQMVNSDAEINGIKFSTMYFKLGADIDLSVYRGDDGGKGWTPIGTDNNPFKGNFDGGGYKITGLYINRTSNYQGLFGCIDGGTVKNVGVVGCDITGYDFVGGVAGAVSDYGKVEYCYSTGTVSGTNFFAGGVAGGVINGGSVSNCYSTGTVSGTNYVGGVAGAVSDYGKVEYCYSTGTVSGNSQVGGVVGGVTNSVAAGILDGGIVENCAALNPSVTAPDASGNAGRVVGEVVSGTLTNNYAYDGMTVTAGGSGDAGTDIIAANIIADGTLGNLFTNTNGWTTADGFLPGLFNETVNMPAHIIAYVSPFPIGDGSNSNPYEIETAEQLAALAILVNEGDTNYNSKYYKLMNDIDISGYGDIGGWIPIGTYAFPNDKSFKGNFDGNKHKITGLYINRSGSNSDIQGLFGFIGSGGTVKNVGVVGCAITGKESVGGVAGVVESGSVSNCYSTGTVSGTNYVGGVAGWVEIGGSVSNCYSTGTVSGTNYVGGVAGWVEIGGSVSNCYSTGTVSGTNAVGGVVGHVDGIPGLLLGKVENCAALNPSVTATNTNGGRVVGNTYGTLTNNYAYSGMTVNGSIVLGGSDTGTDIDADAIIGDGTLGNLFTDTNGWTTADGSLPGLFGKTVNMPAHILANATTSSPFAGGDGLSESTAYQIKTAEQLAALAILVNNDDPNTPVWADKSYLLTADINIAGYGDSGGWIPIGTNSKFFKGNFDGGGHKITGLYINRSGNDGYYQGLFGYIGSGGTVANVGVVGCNITGYSNVGGVAGQVYGGGSVSNCYSTGTVSGTYNVGGVAGYVLLGSSVSNCYSTGTVSGTDDSIGGVAGQVYGGGSVSNSYSTGTVSGNNYVGGVAGQVYGSVSNSYSTGTVSGNNYVGGVTGQVVGGKVETCAALNPSVTANSANAGRIAGGVSGSSMLSNNYAYDGMKVNGNIVTSIIGTTTKEGANVTKGEIANPSFWENIIGWDNSIWEFNQGYLPILIGLDGQTGGITFALIAIPISGLTLTVTVTGTDISGNPGNYSVPYSDVARTFTVTVTGMEGLTFPQVTIAINGAVTPNTNGIATLTVPAGYSGTITITVTLDSDSSIIGAASLMVAASPTDPVLPPSPPYPVFPPYPYPDYIPQSPTPSPSPSSTASDSTSSSAPVTEQTPSYKIVRVRTLNGDIIMEIDTTTSSVKGGVITIKPGEPSDGYSFEFNFLRLQELEKSHNGGRFDITMPGIEYELPFDIANIITGLADFLKDENPEDYSLRLTISKLTGDELEKAREAFKKSYPDSELPDDFYDISFSLYKNGKKVNFDVNQFDNALTFRINTSKRCNAVLEYNRSTGKFSFVSARFSSNRANANTRHHSIYAAVVNNVKLSDVKPGAWYEKYVINAANKALVEGYKGMYEPERAVTRAEFVQMIVNAMQLPSAKKDTKDYNDVNSKTKWYYNAVTKAKSAGLLSAFTDDSFRPDDAITREEMASILAAVLRKNNASNTTQRVSLEQTFEDYADMGTKYLADIELVYGMKLMDGVGGGCFEPKSSTIVMQLDKNNR